MSRLKDYPIDSQVPYKNAMLIVVAQKCNEPSCKGCYFGDAIQEKRHKKIACYTHGMACTAFLRKDKHHIIFKEIRL